MDGKPDGWEYTTWVTAETENKITFVRFDAKAVKNDKEAEWYMISQEIDVPRDLMTITLSARLRMTDCSDSKRPLCSYIS